MATQNSSNIPTTANTVPAGNGTGFSSVSYGTTSSASTLAQRDANSNLTANSIIQGYATTATAAGTTTLTVSSAPLQYFTGTTTQTVVMPVTSTLVLGQQFTIVNNSTGVVTVQSSGANTIQAMSASTELVLTVILTSGTSAASWGAVYSSLSTGSSIPSSATSNQVLQSVASSNPVWSTATYPATTTINRILYSSAANVVGQIATGNSSVLVTNGSGVPSLSTTLPNNLAVSAALNSAAVTFSITNSGTTNASNARLLLSCANAASNTYSYVGINTNIVGNQWNIGASAPTNTGLCIWQGNAPATGTLVSSMDGTGVLTLPLQPAFIAYLATNDLNVTGDGTVYTLGSGNALTVDYDQGTNFTTGGVFTAPLTGVYHFDMTITLTGLTVQTSAQIRMLIAGITYLGPLLNPTPSLVSGELTLSFGVTTKMLATNTATFEVVADGATLTVGVSGATYASYVSGSKVA